MLRVQERRPRSADAKTAISNVIALAESCSRQLRGWAASLQTSPIKGQRHLNNISDFKSHISKE